MFTFGIPLGSSAAVTVQSTTVKFAPLVLGNKKGAVIAAPWKI